MVRGKHKLMIDVYVAVLAVLGDVVHVVVDEERRHDVRSPGVRQCGSQ